MERFGEGQTCDSLGLSSIPSSSWSCSSPALSLPGWEEEGGLRLPTSSCHLLTFLSFSKGQHGYHPWCLSSRRRRKGSSLENESRWMYVCLHVYIRICGGWKPNPCRPLKNSTSSALRDLKSASCFSEISKDQTVSVSPPLCVLGLQAPPVVPGCHVGAGPHCGTASTLPTEPPLHSGNSVTVTALDTLSRAEINRPGHRQAEDLCRRFQPYYHPF